MLFTTFFIFCCCRCRCLWCFVLFTLWFFSFRSFIHSINLIQFNGVHESVWIQVVLKKLLLIPMRNIHQYWLYGFFMKSIFLVLLMPETISLSTIFTMRRKKCKHNSKSRRGEKIKTPFSLSNHQIKSTMLFIFLLQSFKRIWNIKCNTERTFFLLVCDCTRPNVFHLV